MAGSKTHEQQLRMFERKDDLLKRREADDALAEGDPDAVHPVRHPEARQSEFPVSRGGLNQESRQHHKNRGSDD